MNCLEADGFMRKADFTVSLAGGLHARPAALFSQEAGKFKSRVVMRMKGKGYDGKSVLAILGMFAIEGSTISLVTEGIDEQIAFETLEKLLATMGVRKNEIPGFAERKNDTNEDAGSQ